MSYFPKISYFPKMSYIPKMSYFLSFVLRAPRAAHTHAFKFATLNHDTPGVWCVFVLENRHKAVRYGPQRPQLDQRSLAAPLAWDLGRRKDSRQANWD